MFLNFSYLLEKAAFEGNLIVNTNYLNFLICILFAFFLSCLIVFLYKLITTNQVYIDTVDKVSGFECGFASFSDSRSQFVVKFYFVCVFFLLFDLEVTLLFPLATYFFGVGVMNHFVFFQLSFYTFVLWLGIYLELKKGILEWS
jgi:NADH-quinone oxidoreductase subunit A